MERATDWARLWRELVEVQRWPHSASRRSGSPEDDPWATRAQDFARRVRRKWARQDPIRDFVAADVGPESTVLDIGAGTGSWAVYLAKRVRKVTAIEPSPAMRAVLAEGIKAEGVTNVEVVEGYWPEVAVEPHDVSLCSHAMYGSADLPGFVRRMVEITRQTCYLLMRVPTPDGVMAEAAQHVWGQPHDSPNFVVGYNVLLQMGICANVVVDPHFWEPWSSPTLDAALGELKGRLGLDERSEHDEYLRELLARRLTWQEDRFVWPKGVHSALAYWRVSTSRSVPRSP